VSGLKERIRALANEYPPDVSSGILQLVYQYIFRADFWSNYLFSPRKSPPTPIGHLGEGAHKVFIYDLLFFLLFYTTTFASFISPKEARFTMKVN
jgi:hypothetical protein